MQIKKSTIAVALLAIAGLTGAALAAKIVPMPIRGQILQQPEGTMLSTELVGASVRVRDREKAGSVSDLILTKEGAVKGVVISVGGILGLGARKIAMGLEDVRIANASDKPTVALSITNADLERAPSFQSLAELRTEKAAGAVRQDRPVTGNPRPTPQQQAD